MALTHTQRTSMFNTLAEVMGQEDAETLMQHLPPSGWDNILRLLELERDRFIAVPIRTTPESAPIELANLAVRQSRRTSKEGVKQVAIPHPRFEEAIAAARAEPDEDKAFEAAKQILDDEDAWAVFQRPV